MQYCIVNGFKINVFKYREEILKYIENKKTILIAMNAEKILKEEEYLKKIVNENIGYPDGIGAVMALKSKGIDAVKIPGCELWLNIIEKFRKEKSFYLIGSTKNVITNTVEKLKKEYPNINILGYRNGFLNENDKSELKNELLKLKPDIIFVAQGSPRQEYLMAELFKTHPAIYMGLGGSFDIYAGVKKRAPKIFIAMHLEWLYRLLKEPIRIKRQIHLIKFFLLLKLGKL